MTNVDWSNAEFIIDDTEIGPLEANSDSKTNIFNIASMYESQKLTLTGDKAKEIFPDSVGPETTKINWTADYPVMMILYNSNHQDHVRYGGDYTTRGRTQKEIILVDENGNIDPQTRLLYDFTEVTNVVIRRIDDDP